MADHLENTADAPASTSDSNIASKALISEVNSAGNSAKLTDNKADPASTNYVNALFGALTIVGDDIKSVAPMTNCSSWNPFDTEPSEADKQALRDLGHAARDKAAELLEPEKKAEVEKLGDGMKDEKAREQFKRDIETVEHRNPPVSLAERGKLYSEVARLLEAPDRPPLSADDRTRLAQEIMHKAADPTSIDQGSKGTCNVATVESRTFTRDPAAAAKVIVDVATTGQYTAADGTKVTPDPGSIKPDVEVRNPGDYFKNPRDHADQIFQITAANAVWQNHDLTVQDVQGGTRTYPKGTVEYRQTDPVTGAENGEGLYDKSKNPPEPILESGKPVDHPHIDGNQITDLSNTITGRSDKDFVLEHAGPHAADKTFKIESEQQLKDKLADMKKNGDLPAIIEVNTGNPPFWGENIKLTPGFIPKTGENGAHVVTITDYDEKTGLVSLDNQWGKGRDHIGPSGISTGDLYIATMPPGSKETIEILQRDVQWNCDHHTINTSKELELLRQENAGGQLSEADLKVQLDKTMDDARKRWEANGTGPEDTERKQAEENYAKINKTLEKHPIINMQQQ